MPKILGLDLEAVFARNKTLFGDVRMETATLTENPLITSLRDARDAAQAELETILKAPTDEKRNLSTDESARFDAKNTEIRAFDERITELVDLDKRNADAAAGRVAAGATGEQRIQVGNEPNPVYRKGDRTSPSFFKDLAAFQLNTVAVFGENGGSIQEARARLAASQETRAGDMTTVAGAGGEFAPPLWLIEDFIPLLRAGRQAADRCNKDVLPQGVASINLPKVSGGATTGVQATQNSAVSETAMTTTSVSSGITTIAGMQIVSIQLLQQSGISFDQVILGDLARDYAKQLDLQVLTGTGSSGQLRGFLHAAGLGARTFTSASPAVTSATAANSFYNAIIGAINTVNAVFLDPNAIIMHPQRWNWVLEGLDSQTRPLVLPNGQVFNAVGSSTPPDHEGAAGTLLGLPVYKDANIPVNIGGGTNQDVVYVGDFSQVYLYETALQSANFDATYANNLSILFRVHAFSALIPDRYAGALCAINGTGLVTPTL